MIHVLILQAFGATLASVGVVLTALVLWTILWAANRYESKLAEKTK